MKMKRVLVKVVLLVLTMYSVMISASENVVYFGVKGGNVTFPSESEVNQSYFYAKDSTGYSFYGGVEFSEALFVELEYSNFDTESINDFPCLSLSGCKNSFNDINVDTYGFYIGIKDNAPVYYKFRIGYVYGEIVSSENLLFDVDRYIDGVSIGIGGGVQLGAFDFEVENTYLMSDIHFISMGLRYRF